MGKRLTDDQIAAYHRDGFLSPVDIFTEDEAAAMRAEFEAAERRWPEAFAGASRANAHYNFTFLDRIVHDTRLVDAVEDLIGPDILVYASVFFVKEARDPGFVSWHQDSRYIHMEPDSGVTAWVALSPASSESGCMQMIPGSHKAGMKAHIDTFGETNILTRGQDIEGIDESKAVETPLRPGQVSFHSMRVIHGSQPNRSDDRRIGFAIQSYLPPDVRPRPGVEAQLVRGRDTHGHFTLAPRPVRDMDPGDVRRRDALNALWADILYEGAEKRRNL